MEADGLDKVQHLREGELLIKLEQAEARLAAVQEEFENAATNLLATIQERDGLKARLIEVVAALEQYHQVMTVLVIHLETHNAVVEPKTSQVSEQVMTALKEARDAGEAALAKARP